MDCFQILPDLSVKNGADFIPFNFIMWRSQLGLGKGKREREPVKPSVFGLAGPVGVDQSGASRVGAPRTLTPCGNTELPLKRQVPSALWESGWCWGCMCVRLPRFACCRRMGVAGGREQMDGFPDPQRVIQSGQTPSEDALCREMRRLEGAPLCPRLCLGMGCPRFRAAAVSPEPGGG